MLTATELADMRAVQELAFPDTGTILRGTSSHNEIGEAVMAWGTVASNLAMRLMPEARRQANLDVVNDQATLVTDWVVTIAYGGDIVTGDRVVVGAGTYDVIAVTDEFTWRTAVRAECKRIE